MIYAKDGKTSCRTFDLEPANNIDFFIMSVTHKTCKTPAQVFLRMMLIVDYLYLDIYRRLNLTSTALPASANCDNQTLGVRALFSIGSSETTCETCLQRFYSRHFRRDTVEFFCFATEGWNRLFLSPDTGKSLQVPPQLCRSMTLDFALEICTNDRETLSHLDMSAAIC